MKRILLGFIIVAAASACGASDSGNSSTTTASSSPPVVQAITPSLLHVGDELKVIGANFLSPLSGTSMLLIKGRFFDNDGVESVFERTVEPEFIGTNELTWRMWPDVVFHPDGDRQGYFVGAVTVINHFSDGSEKSSKPQNVKLDIAPSLVLRALRPSEAQCGDVDVVESTTRGVPLTIAVKAIGLTPGTPETPLVFDWSLGLDLLDVKVDSNGTFDLDTATQNSGYVTITDTVTDGFFSGIQDESGCSNTLDPNAGTSTLDSYLNSWCTENANGQKAYLFKVLSDMSGTGGIKSLRTRALETNVSMDAISATVSVRARDASGNTASLNIALPVYTEVTVKRDSSRDRIVERETVEQVDDSIRSSSLDIEVRYQESKTESKGYSYGKSVTPNATLQFGLNFVQMTTWNVGFSVDVRNDVNTSSEKGKDISQRVPPGMCITYYRQAEKVRQWAKLVGHTQCGQTFDAGEVWLDGWQWAREIATDIDCPAPSIALKPSGPCTVDCDLILMANTNSEDTESH